MWFRCVESDYIKKGDIKLLKELLLILGCLIASIMSVLCLINLIKEIKKIKMTAHDGDIKAIVVDAYVFTTGDIRPILLYTVNGEDKKYTYHFYHNLKEFPMGKEVRLKLSSISGLAYDKKDLIQGLLMVLFATIFFGGGLLAGIYHIMFVF